KYRVTEGLRLFGRVRYQSVYPFAGVAKFICKLIEFFESRLVGARSHLLKPDVAEFTRERRLFVGLRPNDVHVFEARLPVQPQIREVLPEKTEPLAKEENRNQRQHDDGDERVAAEESPDGRFGGSSPVSRSAFVGGNRQLLRGGFHPGVDANHPG